MKTIWGMQFDFPTEEGRDSPAGKSYWLDLRLIRESKGIKINTVHERTRVPVEILSSFERRGFADRKRFNRVYRRSMAAAYARAIEIEPDDVLRSIEETEIGRYKGRLAHEYLGTELVRSEPGAERERRADHIENVESAGQTVPDTQATSSRAEQRGRNRSEDLDVTGQSPFSGLGVTLVLIAVLVVWLITILF